MAISSIDFTAESDVVARSNSVEIDKLVEAKDGDDFINISGNVNLDGLRIAPSGSLDGGPGRNKLHSFAAGIDDSLPLGSRSAGIHNEGTIRNFSVIYGDSWVNSNRPDSANTSGPGIANSGILTATNRNDGDYIMGSARAYSGYFSPPSSSSWNGLENSGTIDTLGGPDMITGYSNSRQGSGINNNGEINSGDGEDYLLGTSYGIQGYGIRNEKGGVINLGDDNDWLTANSIANAGKIDTGNGNDFLWIGDGYYRSTGTLQGSGQINLGKGNDLYRVSGYVDESRESNGRIAGGKGKQDMVEIYDGSFRFEKDGKGKRFKIYDQDNNLVSTVNGFEKVITFDSNGDRVLSNLTAGTFSSGYF